MTEPLTIVGLGGSLARVLRSLAALHVALEGAADPGASNRDCEESAERVASAAVSTTGRP